MDASHSNLNIWLILLVSVCLLAPAEAQKTKPSATPWMTVPSRPVISPMPSRPATSPAASTNSVMFHEPKLSESAPQPPPALGQVAAELSGRLIGRSPNLSIEFVLTLQNNGPQQVKILDPLDSFSLSFGTNSKWPIPVPDRLPYTMIDVKPPKGAIPGTKRDAPYPAPVQFRRIVRANGLSSQKEETITMPPGNWIQIVFETEPVVMKRVIQALQSETGEGTRSFKAKGFLALINNPPQASGRSLYSDPIVFTIPSLQ